LTDDLGINSDDMAVNGGLKHHPMVIVLHHLKVGIEESDQPGIDNTGAAMKIAPVVCPDNVVGAVQRGHHNIFLYPLADSTLWTACKHNSAKETNKICQKK
jgi:hypothetical protein